MSDLIYSNDHDADCIGSLKLIGNESDFPVGSKTLSEATEDWYLLVGDKDFNNILLAEGPYDDHVEWIRILKDRCNETNVYLVPKHPDQDNSNYLGS